MLAAAGFSPLAGIQLMATGVIEMLSAHKLNSFSPLAGIQLMATFTN